MSLQCEDEQLHNESIWGELLVWEELRSHGSIEVDRTILPGTDDQLT
jgi:hypothetical protein